MTKDQAKGYFIMACRSIRLLADDTIDLLGQLGLELNKRYPFTSWEHLYDGIKQEELKELAADIISRPRFYHLRINEQRFMYDLNKSLEEELKVADYAANHYCTLSEAQAANYNTLQALYEGGTILKCF